MESTWIEVKNKGANTLMRNDSEDIKRIIQHIEEKITKVLDNINKPKTKNINVEKGLLDSSLLEIKVYEEIEKSV